MDKSAGYLRVSTDTTDQLNSLANQALIIKNFDNTINDSDIYADPGLSGTQLKNRKQFNLLLYKCGIDMNIVNGQPSYTLSNRKPYYNRIIVKNTSRLARTTDIFQIINLLEKKNVEIYFLDLNKSSLDAESRIMISLMLVLDEQYSTDLSKKIKMGLDVSVKNMVPFQQDIFGYNKDLSVNAKEAKVVRFVFNTYNNTDIGTYSLSKMVLNKFGYNFSKTKIYYMLQNKKYLGYYVRQNVEIPNYQPAIISEELFNLVQNKLQEKKCNKHTQYYQRGLFTGHVYCGYCGQTFRNNSNNKYKNGKIIGKTEFMLCGNKKMGNGKCTEQTNVVKKDYLINKCNNFINKYPQRIRSIKQINLMLIDSMLQQINVNNYTEKMNKLENKLNRLTDGYLDGIIDNNTYINKKKEIEEAIKEINKVLENGVTTEILQIKNIIENVSEVKPKNIAELLKLVDIIIFNNHIEFKLKEEQNISKLMLRLSEGQ